RPSSSKDCAGQTCSACLKAPIAAARGAAKPSAGPISSLSILPALKRRLRLCDCGVVVGAASSAAANAQRCAARALRAGQNAVGVKCGVPPDGVRQVDEHIRPGDRPVDGEVSSDEPRRNRRTAGDRRLADCPVNLLALTMPLDERFAIPVSVQVAVRRVRDTVRPATTRKHAGTRDPTADGGSPRHLASYTPPTRRSAISPTASRSRSRPPGPVFRNDPWAVARAGDAARPRRAGATNLGPALSGVQGLKGERRASLVEGV